MLMQKRNAASIDLIACNRQTDAKNRANPNGTLPGQSGGRKAISPMNTVDIMPSNRAATSFLQAYLDALVAGGQGTGGHRGLFSRVLELSPSYQTSKPAPSTKKECIEAEEAKATQNAIFLQKYLTLMRDVSLPTAVDVALSSAGRGLLRAESNEELLTCIALTLYLKPDDPVGHSLLQKLREENRQIQVRIQGARDKVLEELRVHLIAHYASPPDIACTPQPLAFAATPGPTEVQKSHNIRAGIKIFSHFAREILLLALVITVSSNPEQTAAKLRAALDRVLPKNDEAERGVSFAELTEKLDTEADVQPDYLPKFVTGLFSAVLGPTKVDVDWYLVKTGQKQTSGQQATKDQGTSEQDDGSTNMGKIAASSPEQDESSYDDLEETTGLDKAKERHRLKSALDGVEKDLMQLEGTLQQQTEASDSASGTRTKGLNARLNDLRMRLTVLENNRVASRQCDLLRHRLEAIGDSIKSFQKFVSKASSSTPIVAFSKDVQDFYPILRRVVEAMEATQEFTSLGGHNVPVQKLMRLRFAAQRISYLTGHKYTHKLVDVIAEVLKRVFWTSQDPDTGNSLLRYMEWTTQKATTEKEVFSRRHDSALEQLVDSALSVYINPIPQETIVTARREASSALDDFLEAAGKLAPASTLKSVDLNNPSSVLDLNASTRMLISQTDPRSRSHPALHQRLTHLVKKLNVLIRADWESHLSFLLSKLLTVHGIKGATHASPVAQLREVDRRLDATWRKHIETLGYIQLQSDPDQIQKYHLSLILGELIEHRIEAASSSDNPNIKKRIMKFFRQTYSPSSPKKGKKASQEDLTQDNKPSEITWPREQWEYLATQLCKTSLAYARIDQRIRREFQACELRPLRWPLDKKMPKYELRETYSVLLAQSIGNMPFAEAFRQKIIACLTGTATSNDVAS